MGGSSSRVCSLGPSKSVRQLEERLSTTEKQLADANRMVHASGNTLEQLLVTLRETSSSHKEVLELAMKGAVEKDRKEVLYILIKSIGDIDQLDASDKTILHWCVEKGRVETVQLLLQNKANPNVPCGQRRETAVITAAAEGNLLMLGVLLEAKADVNAMDVLGKTAVMVASEKGHANVVQVLISKNADIHAVEKVFDKTALMLAAEHSAVQAARTLLSANAEVNQRDKEGQTALMHACIAANSRDMVRLLLDKKANISDRDFSDKNALLLARASTGRERELISDLLVNPSQ